jgi:hypothetical protein
MYFCTSSKFQKLENHISLRALVRACRLTLALLLSMLFANGLSAQIYEAKDEYKNLIFTLTLKQDQTYQLEERFLDGSKWVDAGSWEKEQNELILKSFIKSTRKHYYLKFKRAYKFKEDAFRMEGDRLVYTDKGNRKLNGYYRELVIRQLPVAGNPNNIAKE